MCTGHVKHFLFKIDSALVICIIKTMFAFQQLLKNINIETFYMHKKYGRIVEYDK
jgi:hypothetical protein